MATSSQNKPVKLGGKESPDGGAGTSCFKPLRAHKSNVWQVHGLRKQAGLLELDTVIPNVARGLSRQRGVEQWFFHLSNLKGFGKHLYTW